MVEGAGLSQLRRGVLEYWVLAALAGGERYGYELVGELGRADGLLTSEGTIYPLLGGCAATVSSPRAGASRRRARRGAITG